VNSNAVALLGGLLAGLVVTRFTAPGPHGRRALPHRPDSVTPPPSRRSRRPTVGVGRRTHEPAPDAVSTWCDDLARTVRSGSTFHDALRTVVPGDAVTARATANLRLRLERGAVVPDAVSGLGGGTHLQLATGVFAIAGRLGGSPAVAVERTAAALRQRSADRDERAVQAAQARLSAHVLTAMPLAMLGLLCLVDRDVVTAVSTTPGAACIVVGLTVNALGWWWMRHIMGGHG
jgi:Flp pilus assembly protein TadB